MSQLTMRRPHLADLPESPHLPESYVLREATSADSLGLSALMSAAFEDASWTPERVHRELLDAPNVPETYVIAFHGVAVATASLLLDPEREPGTAVLHWVGVHPEHVGRRLGMIVSLAVLKDAAERGLGDSMLLTDDERLPAIKTYMRLGFDPVMTDEGHEGRWTKVYDALKL